MLRIRGRSDGEETKKRIVLKATQLFVQKGYAAVTMNEVCAASNVSKGSLYHHFPSKDELFLYVVEEDTAQWLQAWEDKKKEIVGVEERLYALAEHYANDFQNPLIQALEEFSRSRAHPEDITKRLVLLYEAASHACRDLLKEGMDTGYFIKGDLEDYVIIVNGMLEGIGRVSEYSMHEKTSDDIKKYYRESVRLLLRGIYTG
ncbi:TetR/AcrR family transcriptional regulator [Acinetobacter sp. CUI P1]|uniref:TetR/AcrR family transcriptional regulator n=1 Tax=Paenibacillus sp. G2S3 TaxID=3047872 RepID=UPI001DAA5C42|nr:TetR/AcrR family transcriptional regulator [Paenibacillus sp. G2S3]MBY3619473.1 TetR/AcrR family transcriptional regulator [Acinetobacter sp. CUI P1]WHY20485.1 TetR/AcrR family transcriptional regulator [Paenibacillus sp. G2S3]